VIAIALVDIVLFVVCPGNPLPLLDRLNQYVPWLLWGPGLLLWTVVVVWRFWRDRRQAIWRMARIGVIVFGTTIPLTVAIPFLWVVASRTANIERYKAKLAAEADIPAIRQWAQEYQPREKDYPLGNDKFVVADENLPPFIRKLGPLAGVFFNSKTKEVTISQGSGFGHWGLAITPTTVEPFDRE
jgi:hypothetical protein